MKAVLCLIGFICVQLVCGQDDPAQQCTEGSEWNDGCNNCWCGPGGTISCTKKTCFGDYKSVVECKNGSRWLVDNCNWCSCNNGNVACTLRYCPPETAPHHEHAVIPDPTRPQVQDEPRGRQLSPGTSSDSGSCEPGTSYFDGCNWCTCISTRRYLCTLMACIENSTISEGTEKRAKQLEGEPQPPAGVPPPPARVPPHSVRVLRPLPTLPPPPVSVSSPSCEPTGVSGDRWREKCNWCRCSSQGIGVCTRKSCPPALREHLEGTPECEGAARWKRDCNWCSCSNGTAVCTEIGCPGT